MSCAHCQKKLVAPKVQCFCEQAQYCGNACGEQHWTNIHKFECIGMKREREEAAANILARYDPDQQITLKTKEGTDFVITVKDAVASTTLANLIEDAGIAVPIPLTYIYYNVLSIVVEYMRTGEFAGNKMRYHTLIHIILAANYLDVHHPTIEDRTLVQDAFNELKGESNRWSHIWHMESYSGANAGFTPEEFLLLNDKEALLQEIHVESMRKPPINWDEYRLLDVPKSVIEYYLFDRSPPVINVENGFGIFFKKMLKFRKRHVYFWHLATNYIVKKVREAFPADMQPLSDGQVYQCAWYCDHRFDGTRGVKLSLSDFAIQGKDFVAPKTVKTAHPFEVLAIALKKHGSLSQMELAVEKLRTARDKSYKKQAERKVMQEQENVRKARIFEQNINAILRYASSLGYLWTRRDLVPTVSDYVIVDFATDPNVQAYLQRLDAELNSILSEMPLRLPILAQMVTREKLTQLLSAMDAGKQMEIDQIHMRMIAWLEQQGYLISRSELMSYGGNRRVVVDTIIKKYTIENSGFEEVRLHTTPELFQRLVLEHFAQTEANMEKLRVARETLKLMGYSVDAKNIIDANYDVDVIIAKLNAESAMEIRTHTVSWEAFLNVLGQK